MKFGIVVFPGSNCDRDCFYVVKNVLGQEAAYLWYKEDDLRKCDCIILPGGFSYGDYLRAGAIASRAPILNSIVEFSKKGGFVIGICNGFQVLTETGLLPGALMRNRDLTFVCKDVCLKVESTETPFTSKYDCGEVVKMPIAHMDGNYFADSEVIKMLKDNDQIVFKYSSSNGETKDEANPNGALENIAGICNKERNVLGMMPHPERCSEDILTGVDGRDLFESIICATESR